MKLSVARWRQTDVYQLLLSQLAPLTSSFLLVLATAYWLGPSGRGDLAYITANANLLGQLFSVSLFIVSGNAIKAGNTRAVSAAFRWVVRLALVLVVVGLVACAGAAALSYPDTARVAFLSCSLGALVTLQLFLSRTIQGGGDARAFRRILTTQSLVSLFLGVAAAAVFADSTLVLAAWGVALVTTTWQAYARLACWLSEAGRPHDWPRGACSAHLGLMGQQLLFRADIPILGVMVSRVEVGQYSVASPIANLVFIVAEAFSLASLGQVIDKTGDREAVETRLFFAVSSLIAVILCLASIFMLPLVLPAYGGVWVLVTLLLPGAVIQGYSRIGLSRFLARSDVRRSRQIGLISAVLSVIYVPSIAWWGVIGAAISSTAIYTLQTLTVMHLRRLDGRATV